MADTHGVCKTAWMRFSSSTYGLAQSISKEVVSRIWLNRHEFVEVLWLQKTSETRFIEQLSVPY